MHGLFSFKFYLIVLKLLLSVTKFRQKLCYVSCTVVPLTNVRLALRHVHGGPKIGTLTLPNINPFSKLFHCQNQEKIVIIL